MTRSRKFLAIAIVALSLACFAHFTAAPQAASAADVHAAATYKVVPITGQAPWVEQMINDLSGQGWDLHSLNDNFLIFKKRT